MHPYPLKRKGVREESIGDERYLYGAKKETLTVLNAVAATIWDLCDGDHTLDAISVRLQREFPDLSPDELRIDIESCLHDFAKRNLLQA